ncbi:MFS transporter [Sandaracinus amylolyticus]|uniref:Arabinose efflux permease n=1 Tax=Sandaracinus amylolyticus TaxID=927083 RepID=A0A0F6VZV4_9BACT|nr:MFS transporter [Sandaracinus amylolyticus]AKF03881.1 Arabinose efflux permease [Sandaracinus amylolyticus]
MSPKDERRIILLLAAVQFVNILDFMIVMPLGPDFAGDLGIPLSHLGTIGGAYTLSAALSGFAGAFFLDRFDRRPALALSLLGLAIGTVGGALATGLESLLLARVVAGAFGGPATSVAMSILADVIPGERRGRALGTVMIAFSIASIVGVPVALELAQRGSWHTPFVATGALALIASIAAWLVLPSMRAHLDIEHEPALDGFRHLLTRPVTLLSYAMTWVAMMGGFVLIPNIASYVQLNLHYPREHLGLLYGAGGLLNFATMRPIGRLVDRIGSFRVQAIGTVLIVVVTWIGFVWSPPWMPVLPVFVGFMFASGMRNVSYSTLTSKVPSPEERARFMSLQSMVQHLGSAAGAFLGSQLLVEGAGGALVHMDRVAWTAMALMIATPVLMLAVESRVARSERIVAALDPVPVASSRDR